MKKLIVAMSFLAMVAPKMAFAQQNELGLGWACAISFQGVSQGAQFILGKFKTEAVGTMSCGDANGNRVDRGIHVDMSRNWIAPSVGIGYFEFAGASTEVSLLNASPEVLYGDYLIAQGQIAVIGGVSVMTAVKVGAPQLALQLSIQANHGLGVQLGFNRMRITPL